MLSDVACTLEAAMLSQQAKSVLGVPYGAPYGFTVVRCPTHHCQSLQYHAQGVCCAQVCRSGRVDRLCSSELWICWVGPEAQATTTVRTCPSGNLLGQVLASFTSIVQQSSRRLLSSCSRSRCEPSLLQYRGRCGALFWGPLQSSCSHLY